MNPVFIINLPKSHSRLKQISDQLQHYKLTDYEVIEAYDSINKQKDYINECLSEKKCLFENMYIGYILPNERPGVIGCFASHVQIYNKMINENIQIAYVLEDDIIINASLPLLNPTDFDNVDIVYINDRNYGFGPEHRIGPLIVKKCKPKWGTDGYIVTLHGAKKLIGCCFPMVAPIDTQIRHFTNDSRVTCNLTKQCSKQFPLDRKSEYTPVEYQHISKDLVLNVFKTQTNYVIHNNKLKSDISNLM
jgi:GR25 family glycosyltransferase involved in LPS biosynthesis